MPIWKLMRAGNILPVDFYVMLEKLNSLSSWWENAINCRRLYSSKVNEALHLDVSQLKSQQK